MDALFGIGGQFVGFTMPLVSGNKPIYSLYSPTSRQTEFPKANFPFLIRTSLNIARALANVHATGCVVGDINHSGILISEKAIATLIDCDSFQATVGGRTFLCKVGVPDFTPPELQGKRLDQILRTQNHDAFGLAVVMFNLLFMGRHPFAGRYLGRGDMPLEGAIAQYRFAYSARQAETKMEPPPFVPLPSDIPSELANAFEVAFGQIGSSQRRPTAADWVKLLAQAERDVIQCSESGAHQYFRAARSCPWCRMEHGFPGFLAFAPLIATTADRPVKLEQLIAAVRSIPTPQIVPGLPTLMPAFNGLASQGGQTAQKNWRRQYAAALSGVFLSVLMFRLPAPGPLAALCLLGGSIALALRAPKELQSVQKVLNQAMAAWDNLEKKWAVANDIGHFTDYRKQAEELIRSVNNLPTEESDQINGLKAKQRQAQLTTFLQRFYLDHAKIKGVGSTRKTVLRSYGIETAADVEMNKIQAISGFGPAIAGSLLAWRKSIERRFVFDPKQPISPADVARVKATIDQRKAFLEKQLRETLARLQKFSGEINAIRNSLQTPRGRCGAQKNRQN